jgi:hypothetical protein
MRFTSVLLTDIQVGTRHRKTLGDLNGLAESMRTRQLQNIVLDADMKLVAGFRRLEAAKLLGWTHINANIADDLGDVLPALLAERDENTCRKDLTVGEAVSIGKELEKLEGPKAAQRMKAGKEPSGNFPEGRPGDTRDKVASALGLSGKTYEKAKVVMTAAEIAPDVIGHIAQEMDSKGKVDPAYQQVKEDHPEVFQAARAATSPNGAAKKTTPRKPRPAGADWSSMLKWAVKRKRVNKNILAEHFGVTTPDAQKKLSTAAQSIGYLVHKLTDGDYSVHKAVHFAWQGSEEQPGIQEAIKKLRDMAEEAMRLECSNSSLSWSREARHLFLVEVLRIIKGLASG